jgi:hypothetical protein
MRRIQIAMLAVLTAAAGEKQLTKSARVHALDNNDNFSFDDRFLCFDTRGAEIWKVDVRTGEETAVYTKGARVMAASYHWTRDEIVFIHGPEKGEYAKTNRRGAAVDGKGGLRYLDVRDVTSAVTPAGAHRGGTHRHEYSLDGKRIGFTYDDHLLPEYGRTVGMVMGGRFAVLVPVVPEAAAKAGELVMASGDSWVGGEGLMRGFIGRVKEADGSFRNSLFVVDVPADVDVSTAFAGDLQRFPGPPRGVRVRRLTHTEVSGIVRGSRNGGWIAYVAASGDGTKQVFVISAKGGAARQVTRVPGGVNGGPRWHPSDQYLAVSTGRGIVVSELATGAVTYLTGEGGDGLVWSNDGKMVAFTRKVGAYPQIFLAPFSGGGL